MTANLQCLSGKRTYEEIKRHEKLYGIIESAQQLLHRTAFTEYLNY